MSFVLPDLVIEDVIRFGINSIKSNAVPSIASAQSIIIDQEFTHTTQANNQIDIVNIPSVTELSFTLIGWEESTREAIGIDLTDADIPADARIFKERDNSDQFYFFDPARKSIIDVGISIVEPARNAFSGNVTIDTMTLADTTTGLTFTLTVDPADVNNFNALFVTVPDAGDFNELSVFLTLSGFSAIRATADRLLDMIFDFNSLPTQGGIRGKYVNETIKILRLIAKDDIAIVHSFNEVPARLPCISIQLANDDEDERIALNTDFGGVIESGTHIGRDENVIHANYSLMLGCHTKEPLMTKYLYTIVKYFLLSEKIALEAAGMIVPSFRGSDFKRNLDYGGDQVYTRFITMTGKTIDSWINIDEVVANISAISINTFVGRDVEVVGNSSFGVFGSGDQFDPGTNTARTNLPIINIDNFNDIEECVRVSITTNPTAAFTLTVTPGGGTAFVITVTPGVDAAATLAQIAFEFNALEGYTANLLADSSGIASIVSICSRIANGGTIVISDGNVVSDSTNFTARILIDRVFRNPDNLTQTMVARDLVRVMSVDMMNSQLVLDPLTPIGGKFMPGSQVTLVDNSLFNPVTTTSTTIKTRPDIIQLSGNATRTNVFSGQNSQNIRTGLNETYTNRGESNNNNPSPID